MGDLPHILRVGECPLSHRKGKASFPYSSPRACAPLVCPIGAKAEECHKGMKMGGNHLCLPFFLKQIRMSPMNGRAFFKMPLGFAFGL